ncbi:hypothetical protein J6590_094290 [Homalodisca vitripennis]|nr:hypothetical protein J6590_094290 [Homalodisca vitripennis]
MLVSHPIKHLQFTYYDLAISTIKVCRQCCRKKIFNPDYHWNYAPSAEMLEFGRQIRGGNSKDIKSLRPSQKFWEHHIKANPRRGGGVFCGCALRKPCWKAPHLFAWLRLVRGYLRRRCHIAAAYQLLPGVEKDAIFCTCKTGNSVTRTEGYWDELDRRQPNCLTKARPTAPPITAEHFPFRRRQRCHVSSVVAVIRPRTRVISVPYTKIGEKGVPLRVQSGELVCRVRDYFQREKINKGPILPVEKVIERTAAALEIGKNTVVRIGKEKIQSEQSGLKLNTPDKKYSRFKPVTELDAFQKDVSIFDGWRPSAAMSTDSSKYQGLMEDSVDQMVINIGNESEEDSDSDSSDNEEEERGSNVSGIFPLSPVAERVYWTSMNCKKPY